jgi:hypothetical protein
MSTQSGRSEMGMHKHHVSGRSRTNITNAMARARDVNRALAAKAAQRRARRPPMAERVADVFK